MTSNQGVTVITEKSEVLAGNTPNEMENFVQFLLIIK